MTLVALVWLAFLSGAGDPCRTGNTFFELKAYAAAQEPLWACVAAGNDKEAAHRLALTYRELKNHEEGLRRVTRVPDSLDRQYLQAFLLFRTGRHSDSLRVLESAYGRYQADWRIHHLFALNYIVLDIREGAEASLENAMRLNPGNAELFYQIARFYYNDNRPRESIAAAERAVALFPSTRKRMTT
jgi:tetratricopeptide (TPR) repeat protein